MFIIVIIIIIIINNELWLGGVQICWNSATLDVRS